MRHLALLLVLLSTPAGSAELQPLLTDNQIAPWKGVGKIVVAESSVCTGALVRDNIVLTAAHCLFDRDTRRVAAAADVDFYAGLRNGRYAAKGTGRRIVVHPEFRYSENLADRARYGVDIAIIELDGALAGNGVASFKLSSAFFKGDPVTVVSYAEGRIEYPSMERGCKTELRTRREAEFACSVSFGASGAPVFREGPEGPRIISVVSALLERGDDRLAIGAVLGYTLPLLLEELQRTSPGRKSSAPDASAKHEGLGFRKPPDRD